MGKIFAPPAEIGKVPELGDFINNNDDYDWDAYDKAKEAYTVRIKKWAKKNGGECAGEEIRFPVADNGNQGYARYIVVSLRPLKLIHLPGDAGYQFQYVNRLTAKDIKDKVASVRKFAELFAKKK